MTPKWAEVIKRIRRAAKAQGISFDKLREGANHTICNLDGLMIPVSRHNRHVRIPGLGNHPEHGLPTQARNLDEVEPTARGLIALWLDVSADSVDVDVQVELPESVRHHFELATKLRQEAADAQAAAAEEYRRAAAELKDGGLTVRDIGKALGISYQRVHQLVASR